LIYGCAQFADVTCVVAHDLTFHTNHVSYPQSKKSYETNAEVLNTH